MPAADVFSDEQVLCVPTRELYSGFGQWRGLTEPASEIWRIIAKNSLFKPRSQPNPAYKSCTRYTEAIS